MKPSVSAEVFEDLMEDGNSWELKTLGEILRGSEPRIELREFRREYEPSRRRKSKLDLEDGSGFLDRGCAKDCRGRHGSRDMDEAKRTRWGHILKKFEYQKGIWAFLPCVMKSDWRFVRAMG